MALSFFDDRAHPPTETELASALGRTAALWRELQRRVATRAPGIEPEWGFAGRSTGWGFRLRQGKRVVLYMTPCKQHFLASAVLGEKAVARAREGRLPQAVEALLDSAPRYAEGRGVRLPVKSRADLAVVLELVGIKLLGR
jgi:hypothetical protein